MHTKSQSYVPLAATIMGIAIAVSMFGAVIAKADTVPTVSATILTAGNATSTSAQLGSLVHASTVVASTTGSTTPSGTASFMLYSTQNCTGASTTQSVGLVGGAAISAATSVPASGLSYRIHYSGNLNYPTADSMCVGLVPTSSGTTVNTGLSKQNVLVGSTVYDTATLGNVTAQASGTVSYMVYSDNACTTSVQNGGMKSVINAVVTNSDTLLFNTLGTFYWQAVYSGDSQNVAATSSCGSEILTVASTTPIITTPGTIGGRVFNDQNKNNVQDGSESGLSGWTVWLHTGNQKYNSPISASAVTDSNGNYAFWNLATGTYFVEEQEQGGWNQTSSDMTVVLDAVHTSGDVDFANVMKGSGATSTDQGHGHNGGGSGDNDHHDGTSTTTDQGHGNGSGDNHHDGVSTTTDQGHGYSSNGNGNENTNTNHQDSSPAPIVTKDTHNSTDNNSNRGGRNHGNH